MQTKTDKLIAMMREGNWDGALALAKTFRIMTREQREAIVRGHEARVHPHFYRQIGRDPEALVQAGISTLQHLYGTRL